MLLTLTPPSPETIRRFLDAQAALPFTHAPVGATEGAATVPGHDNDARRGLLGQGDACFDAAKAALRRWGQFPGGWVWIEPSAAPIAPETTVAMVARFMGLHWVSAARIVYVIDEADRFGYGYGTLPGHVECGEERFLVERESDGRVFYDLRAFSRPRHPLIRLAYPLARRLQRRFGVESLAAMERATLSP